MRWMQCLALGLGLSAGAAVAQSYPAKSVRFIVPFPPGGATDIVTRVLAQKLNEQYRRQVAIVDNRGGAGGVVGSELAARAAPDGYTLVMGTTGTHAINASLYAKLRQGATSYATSPEEFAKVVERDVAKWAKVVKASGATAD